MALKVGELYASFGIDSSGIDGAISGIEKKCSAIASNLGKAGAAASLAITTPMVAIGKDIYKAGTSFYAQMSRVEAISGATADEMMDLTAEAIKMGSTTSFTASEAGEALEYMAMAGWKSKDMLDGLAPIMDLAAASGEDLGSVSDIVTDALTAFGLSADDAAHFSNVLAATATNANTDVGKMGYTFQQVGALAGAMGYEIDDVAVAIGIMANAGIKGEKAGTQLRTIIANMVDPTDDMAAAMEKLGISITDTSTGEVLPFNAVLKNLRKSFAGLNEEEKAMYAATIAGKEGMAGLLALINASDEDIDKLTKSIENCEGATGKMAATILNNAAGDVTIFKSAVEGLEITLWGLVEGPFRQIVQTATSWVDSFRLMDSSTQTTILKVAGLAAATGPALVALGGIVGAAGKLIPLLTALASPVGIVASGMALFAVASVDATNEIGKGFVKLSKKLKTSISDINKRVTSEMKTVSSRIPALAKSLSDGLGELVPEAMNTALLVITGFADTIADNASNIAQVGKTIITSVVGGISANMPMLIPAAARMAVNIGTSLVRNIPSLLSSVGELVKSIGTGLKNVDWASLGKEVLDAIGTAFTKTKDLFVGWFTEAHEAVKAIKWTDVWDSIKKGATFASDWLKNLILGDAATDSATWIDVGTKIWGWIKSGITVTGDWLKGLVLGESFTPDSSWSDVGSKLWDSIKSGFSTAGDWIKSTVLKGDYTPDASWSDVGKSIWDMIQTGIETTGDWIKSLVLKDAFTADSSWSDVGEKIVEKISSGLSGLKAETLTEKIGDLTAVAQSIAEKIVQSKADWAAAAGTFISNLVGGLSGYNLWDSLSTSFSSIATSILNGITAAIPKLTNVAVDIVSAIGNLLSGDCGDSMLSAMKTIATSLIDGIVSAIPTLTSSATSIVSALADLLNSIKWSDAIDTVTSLGASIMNAIVVGIENAGTLVTNIVTAVGSVLNEIKWSDIGVSLDGFANMIINGIVNGINTLYSAGESIACAVGEVLEKIKWSDISETAQKIGGSLINGIVEGINAILDGGAKIYTALAGVLQKINWDELGNAAADLATSLIDGLISGMGRVDLSGFLTALGDAIAAAGEGLGKAAGSIVNKLVEFIITPENWEKLIECGGKLVEGLAVGIVGLGKGILEGSWNFVSETFKGLLQALGLVASDETLEVFDQVETVLNAEGEEIVASLGNVFGHLKDMNSALGGVYDVGSLQSYIDAYNTCLANGTAEMISMMDEYSFLGNEAVIDLFNLLVDTSAAEADRAAALISLNELGLGEYISNEFTTANGGIMEAAKNMSTNAVAAFETAFTALGYVIPDAVKTGLESGTITVEEAAAQVVAAASTANDKATAEASASATGEAVTSSLAKGEEAGEKDVTDSATNVVDAATLALQTFPDIAALTGEEGTSGMADAINNTSALVETEAETMASDAVEAALKKMSYETGYSMGYDYVDAVCDGMVALAETLKTTAQTAAEAACTEASNALSSSAGSSIGAQFSNGIAAGIRSGASAIISAARTAANTALNAAKNALGIHSPSAVAEKEVGWMYDEGVARGLLGKLSIIRKAGAEVAASMHDMFLIGDPSRGTVYSDKTAINQTAKKTAEAAAEGKAAQERAEAVGKAIADRLIEAGAFEGDVYMDKEKVGEKVSGTVSKTIKKKTQKTVKGRSLQGVLA